MFGFERHAVLFRFGICISRLHTPGAHLFLYSEVANICKHCAHLQELLQEVLVCWIDGCNGICWFVQCYFNSRIPIWFAASICEFVHCHLDPGNVNSCSNLWLWGFVVHSAVIRCWFVHEYSLIQRCCSIRPSFDNNSASIRWSIGIDPAFIKCLMGVGAWVVQFFFCTVITR